MSDNLDRLIKAAKEVSELLQEIEAGANYQSIFLTEAGHELQYALENYENER